MAQPLGEGLAVVCLERFALADDDNLFGGEHGDGIAGGDDGIGDGRDVGIRGKEDLPGHRVVLAVAEGFLEELPDSSFLAEFVLADERDNHAGWGYLS